MTATVDAVKDRSHKAKPEAQERKRVLDIMRDVVISGSPPHELGVQIPQQECSFCGKIKPMTAFDSYYHKNNKRWYWHKTCQSCRRVKMNRTGFKNQWRRKWKEVSKDIPARAISRFLNEHPEVMQDIYSRYPHIIRKIMLEERQSLWLELCERARTLGNRSNSKIGPKEKEDMLEELRIELLK